MWQASYLPRLSLELLEMEFFDVLLLQISQEHNLPESRGSECWVE